MPNFVKGACEEMCPPHEVTLRTKEHLLHFLELKPGSKNVPGKVVKAFSRSAAGVKVPRKTDLRTERALLRTVEYLLQEIVLDKRKPFNIIFDFIFDRLRSVRQEIVMQNLDASISIKLLEPIILFLSYGSYRLCTEKLDNFDPKICNQHLQECIKKTLCFYDELDLKGDHENTINAMKRRSFIEALYQVFNLGSVESLERAIKLSKTVKDPVFNLAYNISLEYFRGNYFYSIREIPQLPHLLSALASLKLEYLRQKFFRIFSHAYNSKQLTVPVNWLQNLLLFSTENDLISNCKYYNIIIEKDCVKFIKTNFDHEKPTKQSKHEDFIEEKLKSIYLPEILLLKRF